MEVKFKIDVTTEWDLSQVVEMGDDYVTLSSEAFGYHQGRTVQSGRIQG